MLQQERSPSGDRLALVTVTNCGALTDYVTSVTLRRIHRWVFERDKLVAGIGGRHSVTLIWRGDNELLVTLPRSAADRDFVDRKIATHNTEVDGVHIEYQQW